jgi:hypothetical protein
MQRSKGWEPSGADEGVALGRAARKTLPITSDLLPPASEPKSRLEFRGPTPAGNSPALPIGDIVEFDARASSCGFCVTGFLDHRRVWDLWSYASVGPIPAFSYNNRIMDWAMEPFQSLLNFLSSMTYVLSTLISSTPAASHHTFHFLMRTLARRQFQWRWRNCDVDLLMVRWLTACRIHGVADHQHRIWLR